MDPENTSGRHGPWESLAKLIPGFRGYLEKEARRDSDHAARSWIAKRLDACKQAIDKAQRALTDQGAVDALAPYERLRTRTDALASKIRGDVRGYSGFFDAAQVDERLLDKVYDHDAILSKDVESLVQAVERLARSSPVASDEPTAALQLLDDFERQYRRRGEILKGFDADRLF